VSRRRHCFLKTYKITALTGDHYGGEWPRETFQKQGISYFLADKHRSDLYLELLPLVNAARIDILDIPELLRELRSLERRRGTYGRDRVDHRPGGHDDLANVVAGIAAELPSGM
jgi:hypothetical protein